MTLKPDSGRTSGGGADVNIIRDGYDTAQICANGHVINSCSISTPHINRKFCERCGALTITKCPYCSATIRGAYCTRSSTSSFTRPSFCPDCGKPYPWTEAKLKAAKELVDELDKLTPEERELLKKSLDDIMLDTPQTIVAATRFKKIAAKAAKAGKATVKELRKLVVDIASETAKKIILEGR